MTTHLVGTFDIVGRFRELYRVQPTREIESWLHDHGICTWGKDNCDV